MPFQSRYVITENIERFETLLRDGSLDRRQIRTVETLLAQARAELAAFDARRQADGTADRPRPTVAPMTWLSALLT
jgi:hypothetical protein